MTRVHWTCWQPTPYNDLLFAAVAQIPEAQLLVHFREPHVASHPWQSALIRGYQARVFRCVVGIDWTLVRLAARERDATFVFGGWDTATVLVTILVLMLRGERYVIWTDTPAADVRRHPLKRLLRAWWLQRVFKHAALVLGTGAPAMAALAEMGCPAEKLRNLPYFVDLDALAPPCDAASPALRYVSVGRLHEHKGYDLALRALAAVHGRDGDFTYIIAGAGPERQRLEQLARDLGIGERVRFPGWLEPQALIDLYRSGSLFLHPARREPYGVAVLEAMAAGLAVVASDATAAASDRVVDGVNGFIHACDDMTALAAALRRATGDRQRLADVRCQARRTAEQWPVSRGTAVVREVLSRGSASC